MALLSAQRYGLSVSDLSCNLAVNNVRYDPQGMAGGYQMLYYAMVAVVICFIVSLFASYKLVGSCWPAVIVLIGFIVMLFLWYSIMTS